MLESWSAFTMLGFESSSVMQKRLVTIACGGIRSIEEIGLMFAEKWDAALESSVSMMAGYTMAGLIDRYRVRVASNEARLSAEHRFVFYNFY